MPNLRRVSRGPVGLPVRQYLRRRPPFLLCPHRDFPPNMPGALRPYHLPAPPPPSTRGPAAGCGGMLRCRRPALFDEPIPAGIFQLDPSTPPAASPQIADPSALRHVLAFLDGRSIAALVGTCNPLAALSDLAKPGPTPWNRWVCEHVRARVEAALGPGPAAEALANGPARGGASGWLEVLDTIESWRHMRAAGAAPVAEDGVLLGCMRALQRKEALATRVFPIRSL